MFGIDLFPPTLAQQLFLLVVGFVLCAVIGLERQYRLKSAGLRTHVLVGVGSAVFTLVSAYGFSGVTGADVILDPSRIAAQVVSGVGFLGAGVIFVRRESITGLTTAASIWVAAAVGMAAGAGMPVVAAAATGLHLLAVVLFRWVRERVLRPQREQNVRIRYVAGSGVLREVLSLASENGYELTSLNVVEATDADIEVDLGLRLPSLRQGVEGLIWQLVAIEGVIGAERGSLVDPDA